MRLGALALSFAFALSAAACASDAPEGDLAGEVTEGLDEAKADQADLPFTVVEGLTVRDSFGLAEQGRVIRSASSYKATFGVNAPADLDFAEEWVAVYSAGVKPTGGYAASITRVRLSDSGLTVKVDTHLATPGEGCFVTQALTKPTAVVRFPAQPGASRSRFGKLTEAVACTAAPLCGGDLTDALTAEVAGMTYMSESDYPLLVQALGTGAAPSTVEEFRALIGADAAAVIEQRDYNDTFNRLTEVHDETDDYLVQYAEDYLDLRAVMEDNLEGLSVFRVGEIQIDVYFVGVSSCGEIVAVKTTSIET